jgi:hypothetical protein
MVWVADDLAAWLVEQLADAGRRRLTELVLGDDLERALRQAATAAVQATAGELSGGDEARTQDLVMAISERFAAEALEVAGAGATVLERLQDPARSGCVHPCLPCLDASLAGWSLSTDRTPRRSSASIQRRGLSGTPVSRSISRKRRSPLIRPPQTAGQRITPGGSGAWQPLRSRVPLSACKTRLEACRGFL